MQSTNNNTKCKVQWKFDGDKLASEYKKNNPSKAWEGNKKWSDLNDDEKEAVRVDFREKMRNGTDNPKRDGISSLKTQTRKDSDFKTNLLDEDDNTEFDKIFIIA